MNEHSLAGMRKHILNTQYLSGILLLAGTMVIGTGMIVLAVRGELRGLDAGFMGVEGINNAATAFRTLEIYQVVWMILLFLGFGALTILLQEAGDHSISMLSLNLYIVMVVGMAIEGSFHSSVTVWAAREWSMKAAVPEFYEPLRQWVNGSVQLVYTSFGLLAMAGYGWSILRTRVLPRWVGWTVVGWIGFWGMFFVLRQETLPPILMIPPIILGVASLVHKPNTSAK